MRHRHQDGWVELTEAKTWKAHWYVYVIDPNTGKETRRHRSQIVGKKSEMTKWEANEELSKLVAPANVQGTRSDDRVTLEWFWTNRFKPLREGGWSKATRRGCETDWTQYVKPVLGETPLKDVSLFSCQMLLNKLAETKSESVVKRVRVMLSSIMESAVDQDFTAKNPAKKLQLPVCKPTPKPTLTAHELNALLNAVTDTRDHLILTLGVFGGLVSSELFGLTWGAVHDDHIEIRSTAYQGELQVGRVKRRSRHRNIPLPDPIRAELSAWKLIAANIRTLRGEHRYSTSDDALIFPNDRKKRGPMWAGVWLQKHIAPIAEQCGITKPVTFQVLRRSVATRNQKRVKDLQTLLGHSSTKTTMDVYAQGVPESVREMMADDYSEIMSAKPKLLRMQ